MIIDVLDTLLLSDNKEYVVTGKINYNSIDYYYLIEKEEKQEVKFCYQRENKMVEVDDENLIRNLIALFCEDLKNKIENE